MKQVRLIALGVGKAFCRMPYWHSNFLVEVMLDDGTVKRLLIDCGSDIRHSLHDQGLKITDIDAVYVTHPHADHAGGLECLGLQCFFTPGYAGDGQAPTHELANADRLPRLIASRGLVRDLWTGTLKGGMQTVGEPVRFDQYFTLERFKAPCAINWHGLTIRPIAVRHLSPIFPNSPKTTAMWSWGFQMQIFDHVVGLTGDTHPCDELLDIYSDADLILHDSEFGFQTGVHPNWKWLKSPGYPNNLRGHTWLYGYGDVNTWVPDVRRHGFAGLLQQGEVFVFTEDTITTPKRSW